MSSFSPDLRNFRSSYYDKCLINSVEEKKSLNKLLQDEVRNRSKLKQFCMNYTVPNAQRTLLWSLVMDIMPLHKSSTSFIRDQRREVYEDLLRAVTVMRAIDQTKPKELVMHTMWLVETNRLQSSNSSSGIQEDDTQFIDIVRTLLQIFNDDVDTYWMAKGFYQYTRELKREYGKLKEMTQTLLKREDIALFYRLEKLGLFEENTKLLDNWYITCFAGVICEMMLVKIWDKVCGGSRKIVIFLFLELVKDIKSLIFDLNSLAELKALIETVKDLDGVIVNKAIKSLQSNNSEVEYTH